MFIKVKAFGEVRKFAKSLTSGGFLEVPTGADPAFVFRLLEMPGDLPLVFFVNGRVFKKDMALSDGDELVFFSPMEGG